MITDVVLPEMNGLELSMKVKDLKPGTEVLFMSGYTANVIVHKGILEEGVNFIAKPFTARELGQKVRTILNKNASGTASG